MAGGANVTEFSSYNAASLAAYDAVIVYGNMSTVDMSALQTYVQNGGTLIETPWFWYNYSPPTALDIFSHGGGTQFTGPYPGVTVLDPGNPLLAGVSFPAGPFSIGRTTGNTFVPGVNPIANWTDGTAFLGSKTFGTGQVIGINLHVITSDTAYQVINQPWATQLFLNAAGANAVPAAPEPTSLAVFGLAALAAGGYGWRRRKLAVSA